MNSIPMNYKSQTSSSGVALVEVLVGISILAILLVSVSFAVSQLVINRSALVTNTVAVYLAEEGYELVRTVRDNNWNDLAALTTGSTYYLDVSTSTIAITSSPVLVDGTYTRSFVLEEVYRDADDDIVPNGTVGATLDTNARVVTIQVTGGVSTQVFTGLVTNLYTP